MSKRIGLSDETGKLFPAFKKEFIWTEISLSAGIRPQSIGLKFSGKNELLFDTSDPADKSIDPLRFSISLWIKDESSKDLISHLFQRDV